MNSYIKPGAMFITAAGTGMSGASCSTSREEIDMLKDILGISDLDQAFSTAEACVQQYPMEEYCKFTAVENGSAVKILTS